MPKEAEKIFEDLQEIYFLLGDVYGDMWKLIGDGKLKDDTNFRRLNYFFDRADNEFYIFLSKIEEYKRGNVSLQP